MKNFVTNVDMKFPAKNIIFENMEKFSLNNIDKLLYKIAEFKRSLIKIVTNIIAGSSNTNSNSSDKTGDNLPTNPAI